MPYEGESMRKIVFEGKIDCGKKTCNKCVWVYGEAVGDPYCGWFEFRSVKKPKNTTLGKYKDDRKKLIRLPECIAAEVNP
jgi:hypothetical protein